VVLLKQQHLKGEILSKIWLCQMFINNKPWRRSLVLDFNPSERGFVRVSYVVCVGLKTSGHLARIGPLHQQSATLHMVTSEP